MKIPVVEKSVNQFIHASGYCFELLLIKKNGIMFKKFNLRVQMITKTLYNMHIYLGENERLHFVSYKRKYISIMNCSKFLLAEIEEMESGIYRVGAANTGTGLL